MPITKRLPDAEFEIMRTVWDMPQLVTSPSVLENIIKSGKELKPQTVLTILVRLEKKGFLCSEKNGKEREYRYIISEKEYMRFEAASFASKFKKKPMSSLVNAMYGDEEISKDDIAALRKWLDSKE